MFIKKFVYLLITGIFLITIKIQAMQSPVDLKVVIDNVNNKISKLNPERKAQHLQALAQLMTLNFNNLQVTRALCDTMKYIHTWNDALCIQQGEYAGKYIQQVTLDDAPDGKLLTTIYDENIEKCALKVSTDTGIAAAQSLNSLFGDIGNKDTIVNNSRLVLHKAHELSKEKQLIMPNPDNSNAEEFQKQRTSWEVYNIANLHKYLIYVTHARALVGAIPELSNGSDMLLTLLERSKPKNIVEPYQWSTNFFKGLPEAIKNSFNTQEIIKEQFQKTINDKNDIDVNAVFAQFDIEKLENILHQYEPYVDFMQTFYNWVKHNLDEVANNLPLVKKQRYLKSSMLISPEIYKNDGAQLEYALRTFVDALRMHLYKSTLSETLTFSDIFKGDYELQPLDRIITVLPGESAQQDSTPTKKEIKTKTGKGSKKQAKNKKKKQSVNKKKKSASPKLSNPKVNPDIQLTEYLSPVLYADRVDQWFSDLSSLAANNSQEQIIYHSFSKLVDNYLFTFGYTFDYKSNTRPTDIDHAYSLRGKIKYDNGKEEFVCFTCTKDPNDVCYHRGFKHIAPEQFFSQLQTDRASFDEAEFPKLGAVTSDKQSGKQKVEDQVLEDNDFFAVIRDERLEMTITLYKPQQI